MGRGRDWHPDLPPSNDPEDLVQDKRRLHETKRRARASLRGAREARRYTEQGCYLCLRATSGGTADSDVPARSGKAVERTSSINECTRYRTSGRIGRQVSSCEGLAFDATLRTQVSGSLVVEQPGPQGPGQRGAGGRRASCAFHQRRCGKTDRPSG